MGLLVFLGGIALLLYTFKLAYAMYVTPPAEALNIKSSAALDLTQAGTSLVGVLIRVLLLVVMGVVGSLIANRGISLFAGSRGWTEHDKSPTKESDEAP